MKTIETPRPSPHPKPHVCRHIANLSVVRIFHHHSHPNKQNTKTYCTSETRGPRPYGQGLRFLFNSDLVYTALVLSTLLYGCEVWSLREDLCWQLRSFHNRLPAIFVASASLTLSATASLQKASFVVWASWISTATNTTESSKGLATPHECP